MPLPGQQYMAEAGGGAGGLRTEDGEKSRAGGRTWIPTTAAGYSPPPEYSEAFFSSSESDQTKTSGPFCTSRLSHPTHPGGQQKDVGHQPCLPPVQQGKARGSPTCWLSFTCCSWRTRLAIWTDFTGYSWSMYVFKKLTSSWVFLILAFSCFTCCSRSTGVRKNRRQDPPSRTASRRIRRQSSPWPMDWGLS